MMTKESLVLLLGFMVLILPRMGIPSDWKEYFLLGAGALLIILGYSLRRRAYLKSIENNRGERTTDSYVESTPETELNQFRDPQEV